MHSKENLSIHNLKHYNSSLAPILLEDSIDISTLDILQKNGISTWRQLKKLTDKSLVQLGVIDGFQRTIILALIDKHLKQEVSSMTSLRNFELKSEDSSIPKSKVSLCKNKDL